MLALAPRRSQGFSNARVLATLEDAAAAKLQAASVPVDTKPRRVAAVPDAAASTHILAAAAEHKAEPGSKGKSRRTRRADSKAAARDTVVPLTAETGTTLPQDSAKDAQSTKSTPKVRRDLARRAAM